VKHHADTVADDDDIAMGVDELRHRRRRPSRSQRDLTFCDTTSGGVIAFVSPAALMVLLPGRHPSPAAAFGTNLCRYEGQG
jgi:hypothetical protein